MQALTKIETAHLPAIDPGNPVSMLLLPEWLKRLHDAVSKGPDGEPTWSRVPMIPASSMPTTPQRQAIERRLVELDALGRPGPDIEIGKSVAKILAYYAHGNSAKGQASVRGEIWAEVLSDLPAWAVEEARRRWFAGKIKAPNGFPPEPADIRGEAEHIVKVARGQSILLQRILAAEPAPEPLSSEERAAVAEKAEQVAREMAEHARMNAREPARHEGPAPRPSPEAMRDLEERQQRREAAAAEEPAQL